MATLLLAVPKRNDFQKYSYCPVCQTTKGHNINNILSQILFIKITIFAVVPAIKNRETKQRCQNKSVERNLIKISPTLAFGYTTGLLPVSVLSDNNLKHMGFIQSFSKCSAPTMCLAKEDLL
jgi:hypothetical protein